jgi:2-amino-4-hydroxy-6-hydroxymethyldihydropteridine diphosphokinase
MSTDRPHWWPACVGIGSNLESPIEQVRQAFSELAELPQSRLMRVSGLYRSAPMGPQDQPDFINAAAVLLTRLDAHKLLKELQKIEGLHDRKSTNLRWGPRTLDLDLLLFGLQKIDVEGLQVPHPGIAERNFVLLPLDELAPNLQVPGLASVHTLKVALADREAGSARIEKITSDNP